MFVLDTNHFRELTHPSQEGERLRERIMVAGVAIVTNIVTAEEALRGWLAMLASTRDVSDQLIAYRKFGAAILMLADYSMLQWDEECVARFKAFRKQGIRIGTMDLKIACIVLEYEATLLTRNIVDFTQVPGLNCENWLD
jgi:tRNA(fMet)-specific endonuclease VapC